MSNFDSNQHISAGFQTLMDQASDTAQTYLVKAIRAIDDELGKGYAAKNPILIAAFIRAASDDFTQSCRSLSAQQDREAQFQLKEMENI